MSADFLQSVVVLFKTSYGVVMFEQYVFLFSGERIFLVGMFILDIPPLAADRISHVAMSKENVDIVARGLAFAGPTVEDFYEASGHDPLSGEQLAALYAMLAQPRSMEPAPMIYTNEEWKNTPAQAWEWVQKVLLAFVKTKSTFSIRPFVVVAQHWKARKDMHKITKKIKNIVL